MIPSWWAFLLLALAAYRLVRLIGWDDMPLIDDARDRLVGARLVRTGSGNAQMGLTRDGAGEEWVYDRPLLNHFIRCAFCQGFWVSVLVYIIWVAVGAPGHEHWSSWSLYLAGPFALSAAVGLIARNLDP